MMTGDRRSRCVSSGPPPRDPAPGWCRIPAMDPRPDDAIRPTAIHADRGAGTLSIVWADAHETRFGAVELRWLCPCAYCRGEAGIPGWLDSSPTLTPEQTRLVDLALVGAYALAPTWGDGHHTGYYPYRLLRDRCPCADCTARRAATGPGGAA